jgi:hypothetical protein
LELPTVAPAAANTPLSLVSLNATAIRAPRLTPLRNVRLLPTRQNAIPEPTFATGSMTGFSCVDRVANYRSLPIAEMGHV